MTLKSLLPNSYRLSIWVWHPITWRLHFTWLRTDEDQIERYISNHMLCWPLFLTSCSSRDFGSFLALCHGWPSITLKCWSLHRTIYYTAASFVKPNLSRSCLVPKRGWKSIILPFVGKVWVILSFKGMRLHKSLTVVARGLSRVLFEYL